MPPEEVNRQLAHLHDVTLDMLNVRYLLTPYPFSDSTYRVVLTGRKSVVENVDVLPRAFFVDSVVVARDQQQLYRLFRSPDFDPRRVALLEENPPFIPAKGVRGAATVEEFGPHRIVISASVDGPACLVVSEVYYPAGWKALVDGRETRIYKTNIVLRSIFVPEGQHRIEFVFDPWTFRVGLWTTIVTTVLLLGLCVYAVKRRGERF